MNKLIYGNTRFLPDSNDEFLCYVHLCDSVSNVKTYLSLGHTNEFTHSQLLILANQRKSVYAQKINQYAITLLLLTEHEQYDTR